MFRGKNNEVKWVPKNGDLIEVQCNIGLYEQRGDYQLNVSSLQQAGLGKLFEEFNQLKQKLDAEGLFDKEQKKTLPPHPNSIGVITSPDASVLRDVITTLKRRNKSLKVIIYPTSVQGKTAPQGVINAIKLANQRNEVDILIVCRGGGSIEDLWSFNDELVAREIFSSRLPIISAIGHQTDITISDFVADLRAPTPTAAAEIISTSYEELLVNLEYFKSNLLNIIQNKIEQLTQRIDFLEKGLVSPIQKIASQYDLILALKNRMQITITSQLEKYREQIKSYKQNLSHLNPNEILSRGYSIILTQNKKIINNASAMSVSDKIKIKFYEGNAEASITKINQDKEL
jgi:exodeoxyribonuclease VII large subunit